MTAIDITSTVGDLVRQRPDRSRIFERLNIDYCCGGKLPLSEACAMAGVDANDVLAQLQQADVEPAQTSGRLVDADAMGLTELADHIEATHHAYLREELPRLDQITEKVARVHGEKDKRLLQVRDAFCALQDELMSHMLKEERILFPLIRQMEASDEPANFHCGSIANPIRQMEAEHDSAGDALSLMRSATDAYAPPEWACNTYRAMLDALATLERDMHQHIHKENNVLFPKAMRRERSRRSAATSS